MTVTGPFAADTNYNIYYSSTPTSDSGTVQPGLEYKNHAQLKGTDQDSSWSVYYTRSFTIDVELAPGFGGFNIAKLLAGSGAPKVPAGTTFDVGIDYTLPGGATVDTYQGWTAPGTVNDTRTGGHTTLKVTSGDTTTYPGTFPTGTVLTLSEDTSTASTTPERTTWAPRVHGRRPGRPHLRHRRPEVDGGDAEEHVRGDGRPHRQVLDRQDGER